MARSGATVINRGTGVIGEIKSAMLSEAAFQAQFGTEWVLANGDPCVGSKYETLTGNSTVPDAGGRVLRGRNNGNGVNPDGDLLLGFEQGDTFGSHGHTTTSHKHTTATALFSVNPAPSAQTPSSRIMAGDNLNGRFGPADISGYDGGDASPNANNNGGNETRMKNITVNYFIKIN